MTRFGVKTLTYCACTVGIVLLLGVAAMAASAPIGWTTWSVTDSTISGRISTNLTVAYTGEFSGVLFGFPSWTPASTFSNGTTVPNPPPASGNMVREFGGNDLIDTLTFSRPVVNPVMALFSVGSHLGETEARFAFLPGSQNWTIEAGGPTTEFDGQSIVPCADMPTAVCGIEGNGTIKFHGTFTSISWEEPEFESYYGFTAGVPIPEPSTLLLLGSAGLGLAGYLRKRFRRD